MAPEVIRIGSTAKEDPSSAMFIIYLHAFHQQARLLLHATLSQRVHNSHVCYSYRCNNRCAVTYAINTTPLSTGAIAPGTLSISNYTQGPAPDHLGECVSLSDTMHISFRKIEMEFQLIYLP
jgi:hypothetical protein